MGFVTTPTEVTTAITDAFLGLLTLISAGYLFQFRRFNTRKILLWFWIMLFLAMGSILGVFVHGFLLLPVIYNLLWFLLYLSLGLAVGLFVVNATYDRWGLRTSRIMLPFMIVAGCIFSIVTQIIPGNFIVFIVYEGLGMLFALGVYLWLVLVERTSGALLITCGILVTIVAAIAQTIHTIKFTVIWQFNYNGLFHVIQMVGIVLLVAGVRRAILPHTVSNVSAVQQ